MHGFGFDAIHDEICVTSPLAQAILIFRGGAKGEEPPVRVIQGPHTQIKGTAYGGNDMVTVDPVNNEIYILIDPGRGCWSLIGRPTATQCPSAFCSVRTLK